MGGSGEDLWKRWITDQWGVSWGVHLTGGPLSDHEASFRLPHRWLHFRSGGRIRQIEVSSAHFELDEVDDELLLSLLAEAEEVSG